MAAKIVKKEVMNDEIKEFGEDAATAINELLGLYGYNDENKRNELGVKFPRNNFKKNGNISQNHNDSNHHEKSNENDALRLEKFQDYSSISSDKDISSRENSKSPMIHKVLDKQENNCSWCHHDINAQTNEIIGSPDTIFCSENCFIFWRRASFKRAKTCDFCRNVRNAVNYVDFNDGTTQLQFCSDKCLNQYKMQIFCRETQAHLELNPHLKDKNESADSLITPELWLKNCRTRSPTPEDYERSKSSSPMVIAEEKLMFSKIIDTKQTQPSSSTKVTSTVSNLTHNDNNAIDVGKKPTINVLPSSKLLSRNMLHNRNLRKRRVATRLTISNKPNQNSNNNISGTESIMNTNFPNDLRAKIHSQMNNSPKSIQPNNFNRPPIQQFMQRPPINLFKYRLPFPIPQHIPMPPQNHQPPPDDSNLNPLSQINPILPPPVVLVPYPIPLPIILPIPMPLTAFMRAYQKKETELSSNEKDNESHEEVVFEKSNGNEKPLDLSSEQQNIYESDKIFLTHIDDDDEQDTDDAIATVDSNFRAEKSTINDETHKYDNDQTNIKKYQSKDIHERSRPLRKRKIISTDEDYKH